MNDNFKQFRIIDLTVFSVLAIISTFLGEYLHIELPGAGYYLSFSMLISIVAMLRWGMVGAIPAIIGSLVMVVFGQNNIIQNIIMYPIANTFVLGAGWVIRRLSTERIVNDSIKLFQVVLIAFLALTLGKFFGLLILGEPFAAGGAMFFLTQLFNIVMTYIVLLLVRKREGLLVEMKQYFAAHYVEYVT